jgi:hypothetical protein
MTLVNDVIRGDVYQMMLSVTDVSVVSDVSVTSTTRYQENSEGAISDKKAENV